MTPLDPTLAALGEILRYMVTTSGVEFEPGAGTSLHPLNDDVFEVRVGGTSIGTLHRSAILAVAEQIRSRRN